MSLVGKYPPLTVGEFRDAFEVSVDAAAHEFARRGIRVARGVGRRLRLAPDRADDLVQDSFLVALVDDYAALRRARAAIRFEAWLGGIMWNLGRRLQREALRELVALEILGPRKETSWREDPDGTLASARQLVYLSALSPAQKMTLILRSYGYDEWAIAVLQRVTRQTIEKHGSRGVAGLRALVFGL